MAFQKKKKKISEDESKETIQVPWSDNTVIFKLNSTNFSKSQQTAYLM